MRLCGEDPGRQNMIGHADVKPDISLFKSQVVELLLFGVKVESGSCRLFNFDSFHVVEIFHACTQVHSVVMVVK